VDIPLFDEQQAPVPRPEERRERVAQGGPPRYQRPNRAQVELRPCNLDALIPEDHAVRTVWAFVQGMDLWPLYHSIRAVEGGAGRPPIDPAILIALWLYATLEGVGSARMLERLCQQHDAYRWLCGGVSVNYHTLADFRVAHGAFLDHQLTVGVATLLSEGLVSMKRVAQDGVRIRASAATAAGTSVYAPVQKTPTATPMPRCPRIVQRWPRGENAWAPNRPKRSTSSGLPPPNASMPSRETGDCANSPCVDCRR
jgi:transposase